MDRFVVGTGRCGSTLLSAMLHEDPALLSISEFFVGLDRGLRFHPDTAPSSRLAALLNLENPEGLNFTKRRILMPEIRYPYDAPSSRYGYDDAMPWILQITVPSLSDAPEALLEDLTRFLEASPDRPLAEQYRAVFRWLADRRGASDWVERSGSSFEYLDELIQLFPQGRYLHLHRDGREASLSMREHVAFRYRVAMLYEIPDQDGVRYSFMRSYDPSAGPSMSEDLTGILYARAPVEFFGRYWSDQVVNGYDALARLDSSRFMELAFEDLIDDTEGSLEALAEFFELRGDRSEARRRAAGLVRGHPRGRYDSLSAEERFALDQACEPGMKQLGRAR